MLNFNDLQKLVDYVSGARAKSNFYRNLYQKTFPTISKDEWLSLPFVTKETLLAMPLWERSFVPLSKLDHVRTSSGTSGKPPLFSPRTLLRHTEYRLLYHDFKKPILAYLVPAMPHWHEEAQRSLGVSPHVISFDPTTPQASARLAALAHADSMSLFAFHIPLVGPHLKREGVGENFKFIEICGEACTQALLSYMRETFPNATIIPFYGSSEVEDSPMGVPCRAITGEEPLSLYHAKSSHYHELIDPETLEVLVPTAGVEGELVVTAYPGEPCAFPLLRYRTGDMAKVVDTTCTTHGVWSFTLIGRSELDFVKVQGGVLRADEIERVLRMFATEVTDTFTLVAGQDFELKVEAKAGVDLNALARKIESELRIGPKVTYAQGVVEGRFLPLRLSILGDDLPTGKKHKRIVRVYT